MTETIMDMIRSADMPAEEIIAALAKRAAKEKREAKPKPITTQRQAETAAPGLYRAAGAVGLYLNKETVGSGAWSFRFRLGARRRWMGLGALADVTLLDAQTKATEARLMVKKGIDPIAEKRAIRAATVAKTEPAARIFKTVAEDFVAAHANAWKRRNAAQFWFSPLARYAFPVIGVLKLNDIQIEHIGAIVDATPAGIASRIVGRIERIISFAIAHGWRDPLLANPAAGIGALPPPASHAPYGPYASRHRRADFFRRLGQPPMTPMVPAPNPTRWPIFLFSPYGEAGRCVFGTLARCA